MIKKRAQAWGYDLIAGLSIFTIGVFLFFLYSLNYDSGKDTQMQEMDYEASIVGDSLLSEGYPKNWIESDFNNLLEQIGLFSEGKINQTKLNQFFIIANYTKIGIPNSANYNKAKNIFGIKDNFWVNFTDSVTVNDGTGDIITEGIGRKYDGERNVIKSTRVVSYENKIKVVNIFVWN